MSIGRFPNVPEFISVPAYNFKTESEDEVVHWNIKREKELTRSEEYEKSKNFLFEELNASVKSENGEAKNETVFCNGIIKHNDVDVKDGCLEENLLEQAATSTSSNCPRREGHEDYTAYHQYDDQAEKKQHLKNIPIVRKPTTIDLKYKCYQCNFQTSVKQFLNTHLIRSHKPKDTTTVKCYHCNFQTIHKSSLRDHLLLHKEPDDIGAFKCEKCDFQTSLKLMLRRHLQRHRDPAEFVKLMCHECGFQTIHKHSLHQHLLRHKKPKEVNTFNCDQCQYQTVHKSSITKHLNRHKKGEECDKFKCHQCDFETFYKSALNQHLRTHKQVDKLQCDQCDFQTAYKKNLKKHFLRHT